VKGNDGVKFSNKYKIFLYFTFGPSASSSIPSVSLLAFDAGHCCQYVDIVLIVTTVTIAVVILPVAVIALAFVLRCTLVVLLRRLVVACCLLLLLASLLRVPL
jgi:hypothetical protein